MAGPKQLSNQRVSAHNINSSIAALHVVQLDSTGGIITGGVGGGSTQVSVREILSSSGGSLVDSSNVSLGVTIRAGSASGTEYTDGDVDATVSGGAILFDNSSNTLRPVTITRGLPVNIVAGAAGGSTVVTVSTGSVRVHQSSAADLNVTVAGYSTIAAVSSVSGIVTTRPSDTNFASSAGFHFDGSGNLNVAASTQVTVSSVAGAVIVRSSAADSLHTVYQSTYTALNGLMRLADRDQATQVAAVVNADPPSTTWGLAVRQVGAVAASTQVAVSSVAGTVTVRPSDTNFASSAGFHFDGSGNLLISGASASTIVTVSTGSVNVAGILDSSNALVKPGDSGNNALRVNIVAGAGSGGTALADETTFSSNVTSLTPVGGAVYGSTSAVAAGEAGVFNMSSNRALWVYPVDSSGGRVTDSTQRAIRVTSVDAGGSTQVTVSSGAIKIYGSSGESVAASTAAPATGDQGLIVRQVGYSTTVNVSSLAGAVIMRSSAADALVTASQGGTWNIGTVTTVTSVSSLAGAVVTRSSAADALVTVYQSTYTALNGLMRLADRDQSTQVAGVLNSDPASTTWALAVRQVGGGGSTQVAVSSVAGTVQVHALGNSTAADYIPVRIVDSSGTGFLAPGLEYVDGSTTSTLAAPALAFNNSSNNTMRLAGSSSPFPVHMRTSSGADMGDSTNNALRVNVVAGAAGGSTEVTIRQSTFTDLNCRINAPSTANSSNYLPIRITDGTAYLAGSLEYTDGSTTSTLAGPAMMFNNSSNNTMRMVGSTSPLPVAIISGAGSGGTAQADETAFSSNVTNFTPIGGAVLGSTSAVAAGEAGAVNMSSNRALWTFPVDSSGGRITDSTQRALRVTSVDAGGSTQVTVSSGAIRLYGSSGESVAASTAAPATGDQGLIVRQVGYSTTINVSSVAGAVIMRSSAADALVTASQGGTWNIGTVTAVSSLAGAVITRSSAADALVTVYQSTYTAFNGLMRLADRDQSTQVAAVLNADPPSTTWGLAVRQVGAVAASTQVAVSSVAGRVSITLQHDSAGLINAADSTNNALRVNVVAGAAGGSTEVTVRQSTYADFNTLSRIADRDQSTQVAAVLNGTPDSTVWALAVRTVGSAAGSTEVTIRQSTFTDLNCRINAPSTANSSNFLPVRITNSTAYLDGSLEYTDGSTVSTFAGPALMFNNSSNATMRMVGSTTPLPVAIRTPAGAEITSTTIRPTTNAQAWAVRTVLNDLQSTCFSTLGNNSTSSTIVSSAAGIRHKVFAYSITSTAQAVNTLSFASSLATPIWQMQMQSMSSGITGANLAVTPPAWLFATAAADPLVFKITGSTGTYHVSFSYFSEA